MYDGAPVPAGCTQLVSPAAVPLRILPGGIAVRVLIGTLPDQGDGGSPSTSPIQQRGSSPVLVLHARAAPGADATLKVPAEMNGFLFVSDPDGGRVVVGPGDEDREDVPVGGAIGTPGANACHTYGGDLVGHQMATLPPGGTDLRLRNPSLEKPCELLIFLGIPCRKPYFKYCGYGGAMVHANRELVEEAMSVYEQDPKNFGRDDSSAQIDWSRYFLVSGFQDRGGPGLEREDGVLARFAETAELAAKGAAVTATVAAAAAGAGVGDGEA